MNTVFIQANNKQVFGARLAEYALKKNSARPDAFDVKVINVDELPEFKNFGGAAYLRDGKEVTYDPNDLQSFTLSRFMPPELMGYQGRAIVIDPDIFAIADINELFSLDLKGAAIAACPKKGAWDTSVMMMECARLSHWKVSGILQSLRDKKVDYSHIMTLSFEKDITPLSREWNSLDVLNPTVKMLHTTNRLTQPWKTGLPIDFTRRQLPKLFGIIPREPVLRLIGRYPMTYQPHPDKNIDRFFFKLLSDALKDGAVTEQEVRSEIARKTVRPDLLACVATV